MSVKKSSEKPVDAAKNTTIIEAVQKRLDDLEHEIAKLRRQLEESDEHARNAVSIRLPKPVSLEAYEDYRISNVGADWDVVVPNVRAPLHSAKHTKKGYTVSWCAPVTFDRYVLVAARKAK